MVLISCVCLDLLRTLHRDHEIDPELGTPLRNHINFPGVFKEKKHVPEKPLTRVNVLPMKRKLIPYHSATETVEKRTVKQVDKVQNSIRGSDSTRLVGQRGSKPSSVAQKSERFSNLSFALTGHVKSFPKPHALTTMTAIKAVPDSKVNSEKNLKSNIVHSGNADKYWKKPSAVQTAKPLVEKQRCSSPVIDVTMQRR